MPASSRHFETLAPTSRHRQAALRALRQHGLGHLAHDIEETRLHPVEWAVRSVDSVKHDVHRELRLTRLHRLRCLAGSRLRSFRSLAAPAARFTNPAVKPSGIARTAPSAGASRRSRASYGSHPLSTRHHAPRSAHSVPRACGSRCVATPHEARAMAQSSVYYASIDERADGCWIERVAFTDRLKPTNRRIRS